MSLGGPQMNKFEQVCSADHQIHEQRAGARGVPGLKSGGLANASLVMNGHMGNPHPSEQTDTSENITFP